VRTMTSAFDRHAQRFEQHRAFPAGVPDAIRQAIWASTGAGRSARLLDLGAGSGRIGRAFVEANDSYVGLDFSFAMLREFRARSSAACLVQADGGQLPFPDSSFEMVLLMQVLSGTQNPRSLLGEAARVIVRGGFVVVGYIATPPTGVDARMKARLALILDEMGVAAYSAGKSRERSFDWLYTISSRNKQITATSWKAKRTAREFLDRHSSGARFSSLPLAVQTEALKRLGDWADKACGSLDEIFSETHSFELHLFGIG
jgi:ubiquinone/menaquinone biosynthesis C-methylase UbiE